MNTRTLKVSGSILMMVTTLLAGCSALGQGQQPLPTVVLDQSKTTPAPSAVQADSGGGVTASGTVMAAQQAQLGFPLGGELKSVNVSEGDVVKAGQVLARLTGDEEQQAAVSAAELSVLSAQQDLERLQKGAALVTAQAQLAATQAQKALDDAQKHRRNLDFRASADQIAAANANYILAQNEVDKRQEQYDSIAGRPEDDATRALALANLENAKKARDKALINLNWYKGKADPKDISEADADLAVAQAKLDDAKAQLEKVQNGPDPDQFALLQSRLKSAQDQANAARASLENLELKAPINGTVVAVSAKAGEMLAPAKVLIVISDVSNFYVETTDLSERDVPMVAVGQPVRVHVKALNKDVKGKVTRISPVADTLGGDVVYKTRIEMDEYPSGLRAGMSVDVQFGS
ncbi:MAG TPA: efflux RND transporter periplasmic adaptor subunit [Anaerolineaceae bacterium]|nr:efflux RND transporter periplasmic adaptor subunit [Anaerolineaceae bacterium]